jgi:hypothetical protein
MNPLKAMLFAAVLVTGSLAFAAADPEATKEAEQLLSVIGMKETLAQATAQMVAAQMQQNPALAPFKTVMLEYFNQYMSYDSLKSEMVTAYTDAFTSAELKELNTFYGSAVGQKAATKMPEIMGQVAQIGATRVQANISDLEAMIKEEAERIQQEQQQQQQQPQEQQQK